MKMPKNLWYTYWTLDQVAECTDVNMSTYKELWSLVQVLPFREIPYDPDGNPNALFKNWEKLSEESQKDIIKMSDKITVEDKDE